MKVKELIEELEKFSPDLEVIWDDVVEGNSCPVTNVFISTYGDIEGVHKGVYISPDSDYISP